MERRDFLLSGLLAGIGFPGNPGMFDLTDRRPLKAFYVPPSAPPSEGPAGAGFQVKVRATQTNTQFSCIEGVIGAKTMGPAPHIHKNLDELVFVQEGTISIMVGETIYKVEAGGWHFRPHGIVHTFWNGTETPARYIEMYFNQDFENFLEKMFLQLIPDLQRRNISLTSKEANTKMDKLYRQYGIVMFADQRQAIMTKYGLTR